MNYEAYDGADFSTEAPRPTSCTIERLLGAPHEEPQDLLISKAPTFLAKRVLGNSTRYYLIPDFPLNSDGLFSFMDSQAPNRNFSKYGTLDDFQMPDRTSSNSYYENLERLHHEIPHWAQFMEHRAVFRDVLSKSTLAEILKDVAEGTLSENTVVRSLLPDIMTNIAKSPQHPMKNYVNGKIIQMMRTDPDSPGKIGQFLLRHMSESMVMELYDSSSRKNSIVYKARNLVSPVAADVLLRDIDKEAVFAKQGIEVRVGNKRCWITQNARRKFPEMQLDGTKLTIDYKGTHFVGDFMLDDDEWPVLDVNKTESVEPTGLLPVLSWDQTREGFVLNLNPNIAEELSGFNLKYKTSVYSSLAGAMLIPYFEGDLFDWPRRRTLPFAGRTQMMRAPQVPILTMESQDKFVNSRLIKKAEAALATV